MTRYHRRRTLDRRETLKAAALGVGAGIAAAASAFYLARLFLGREILGSPSEPEAPGKEEAGSSSDGRRASAPGWKSRTRAAPRSSHPSGGTGRSSGP